MNTQKDSSKGEVLTDKAVEDYLLSQAVTPEDGDFRNATVPYPSAYMALQMQKQALSSGKGEVLYRKIKVNDRKPEQEKQVLWINDISEEPPFYGVYRKEGEFEYVITLDSSGEEEYNDLSNDLEWLEAIPFPATKSDNEIENIAEGIYPLPEKRDYLKNDGLDRAVIVIQQEAFKAGYKAAMKEMYNLNQ